MKRKTKPAALPEEERDATELTPAKKLKKEKKLHRADLVEDCPAAEAESETKKSKAKKKNMALQEPEAVADDTVPKRRKNEAENSAEDTCENEKKQKKIKKNKEPGEVINSHNNTNLRLFIKNIPTSIDEATLRSDFEVCGKVTNLKLLLDSNGQSRGLAFVTFSDEAGCLAAFEYDNEDYGGKKLKITRAETKQADTAADATKSNSERSGNRPGKVDLRVIVKNIPLTLDEEALRRDFEECGTIINLKLMVDSQGQSRGMAFVTYADEAGYFAALKYNGTDYGGKRLVVKRAESSGGGKVASLGPKPPGCNSLVLTKLAPAVTSDDIHDFFKDCGNGPTKVGLLTDNRGQSRCTARVDFQGDDLDKAAALAGSTSLRGQHFCMEYCLPKTW